MTNAAAGVAVAESRRTTTIESSVDGAHSVVELGSAGEQAIAVVVGRWKREQTRLQQNSMMKPIAYPEVWSNVYDTRRGGGARRST